MKHLTVIYNPGSGPVQLYDGPVDELVWSDSATTVKIEGRLKKVVVGQGGTIFDLITKASQAKTQKIADEERAEIASD